MREIRNVPLRDLCHSRFNARRTRDPKTVDRLAERIRRNGFEPTRALWVWGEGDKLAVFAGGTRFEAAKKADLDTVPAIVYEDVDADAVARLADEDNENDEYHSPVPILDLWAEYHRLWKEEGWTQARIAKAKGVSRTLVTRRCSWHIDAPEGVRLAVCDGLLDEGHVEAIFGMVCDVEHLNDWLTTEQARSEMAEVLLKSHRGKSAGVKPSVKKFRDEAKRWNEMFAAAKEAYEAAGDSGKQFVELLAKRKVRNTAGVSTALSDILEQRRREAEEKAAAANAESEEAAMAAAKKKREAETIAKCRLGDARSLVAEAPEGFQLLLTDPPYGQGFQSGRRTTTAKKNRIAGDELVEALALLREVVSSALPRMAKDAHVLVFTGWRHEPEFRRTLADLGLTIKGSLVWVKNNHGTGDLKGSFAPKHERIIHAVKGSPEMVKRIPDVLSGKDKQDSEHPTEKPVDLLCSLIEATTSPGACVVDPFAGSGNTLFAAHQLGRDFFGCEVDEEYHGRIADQLAKLARSK